jgi:histidine ammonia-lyase
MPPRRSCVVEAVQGGGVSVVQRIELTGRAMRPVDVAQLGRGDAWADIAPEGLARVQAAAEAAERVTARQQVYGRNTGVGANRNQPVEADDTDHGLRLLRSHAGGIGRLVPPSGVRAMLAVRANQLLAGGAGVGPRVVEAIVTALNANALPEIHEYGAVGTADLTALAELGLTLLGGLPWTGAGPHPVALGTGDAVALMSSSALTIGQACLAWSEATRWLDAAHAVAALTFAAVDGSAEPFNQGVHERRPHLGAIASAGFIRALLDSQNIKAARIQDPYAIRCVPQVHGAALSVLDAANRVLAVEINAASENPLVSAAEDAVYHHGGFHQAQLTQVIDALDMALLAVGQLSLARTNLLFQPEFTGLRPFLADGEPASSGVMILENAAHAALADLRNAAVPAGLGHAVLSRGVEDHAPFASQAVRQAERATAALRLIIATELVAAIRTLRLRGVALVEGTPLSTLYALAAPLDADTADRPTTADVHEAADLLPTIGAQASRIFCRTSTPVVTAGP